MPVILWLTEEALRFLLAASIGRTLALSRTLITSTDWRGRNAKTESGF